MKRICAWCKKQLPSSPDGGKRLVTHGLCQSCHRSILAEYGRPLQEFLDELEAPLLLVDAHLVVLSGNRRAQEVLKKTLPKMKRRLCGEVIGCLNAKAPEGCGGTVHCKSCAIRRAVSRTYATGKSLRVDAYPDIEVDSKLKHIQLRISTEKLGKVILLRIDKIARPARKPKPGGKTLLKRKTR